MFRAKVEKHSTQRRPKSRKTGAIENFFVVGKTTDEIKETHKSEIEHFPNDNSNVAWFWGQINPSLRGGSLLADS